MEPEQDIAKPSDSRPTDNTSTDHEEREENSMLMEGLPPIDIEPPKNITKARSPRQKKRLIFAIILIVAVAVVVVVVVAVAVTATKRDSTADTQDPSSADWRFDRAAVAADVGVCSEMGRDVLQQQRGHAVDAAITTLLCIGVVNAESSGIGGGMFMLIHDRTSGRSEALIARERAPAAATADMYADDLTAKKFGYRAIAIPGELRGMWEAHQRYGKLAWADLFEPVIRLAEEGFATTAHCEKSIDGVISRNPDIKENPQFAQFVERYTNPDGSWKKAGDTVYAPKLASTLRAVATNGVNEFYTGQTGQTIVQEIRANGGIVTAADLGDYRPMWVEAPRYSIGQGMTLLTTPTPSGGPIIQFILSVIKNYNVSAADFTGTDKKTRIVHKFIEASKFGFALRSYLGDVNTTEVQEVLQKLNSADYAKRISTRIPDDRVTYMNASNYDQLVTNTSFYGGTAHLSVMDQDGNSVSVTSSVNYRFGSYVLSNVTGIVYNNHMADFDTPESKPATSANYIAPGKIPLSAMGPVLVLDENTNQIILVAGSAGSRAIITANAWVTFRSMFTGEALPDIIDDQRVHNQLQPKNIVYYDEGMDEDIVNGLADMGHSLQSKALTSVVQAITRVDGGLVAYSDPRKGGYSAGY